MRKALPLFSSVFTQVGCQLVGRHRAADVAFDRFDSDLHAALAVVPTESGCPAGAACQHALTLAIDAPPRDRRLHPQRRLTVPSPTGDRLVPDRYGEMTWHPEELADVRGHTNHHHTRPGWGLPLIVASPNNQFVSPNEVQTLRCG